MQSFNVVPPIVIVLAAGKGTRMCSELPKVLHLLGGRPLLGHALAAADKLSPKKTIVVVGEGLLSYGTEVQSLLEEFNAVSVLQSSPLGTGHAVLSAKDHLLQSPDSPVVVLFGDTPLLKPETLEKLLHLVTANDCGVAVLGMYPQDPGAYGRILLDAKGKVDSIIEYKDATIAEQAITLCNSGVMALSGPHALKLLESITPNNASKEYYLTDVVALAKACGLEVGILEADEEDVLGVNSRAELAQAEAILQQRWRQKVMAQGATLLDPSSVFFSFDTEIGKDVTIYPNVFFGPRVKVADEVVIKPHCVLEGAILDKGVVIGPFAHLRPGTRLEEGAKVGNFVEIKAARLAKGAKANHLSYIGDTDVGEKANIGAGTITCNYDGFLKYKTIIGANAFIGSNTALVAPIEIGEDALVAAGSTITRDVPRGALAVARASQTVIPDKAAAIKYQKRAQKLLKEGK